MERIGIPGNFPDQESIRNRRITKTTEQEEMDQEVYSGMPYKTLPDCPNCKGAGFVHPHRQDGSVDYSRLIPCAQPGCYLDQARAHKIGEIVANSGVIGLKQTFESFDENVPGVSKAYKKSLKMAEGMGDFLWLIIFGGVGNGKTHLLNAIANRVMERGIVVKLIMMAELLSELRMAIDSHQVEYKMKELKEVPYLLVDELGLELGTGWEKEKIEELMAARWNNGRFTVVATNRDIEDLPPRLKSRFLDRRFSRAVINEAGDYRQTRGRSH